MKSQRILIVDDKEENLYLLQALLGGNGYELDQAIHGADALERARRQRPDLIITDILMPVMDGFTLCRECKKDPRLRSVPIIVYTATYTDGRDRDFALSLGAVRFIVKPEDPVVFIKTIREVLKEIPSADLTSAIPAEETVYLETYNATLIRKLEERSEQLAAANTQLHEQVDKLRFIQEQLQCSELRYRMIFENSMDAILLTVPDGEILTANPAACKLFGRDEAEIIQKGRAGIVDVADPRLVQALAEREKNGRFHGELTFLHADGSGFPGEVSCVVFTTPSGAPRTCMVVRDMQEQKNSEASIRQQLEELRQWQQAMLGRESRIIEIKQEVNLLLAKLGLPSKYASTEENVVSPSQN